MRTVSCEKAPDKATMIEIEFKKGDPIALNGKKNCLHHLFCQS